MGDGLMVLRLKPLDLAGVRVGSVRERAYRLSLGDLGGMPDPQASLEEFYRGLPRVGEAAGVLAAAQMLATAALGRRAAVWAIDGGTLRAGLGGVVLALMRRGLVQGVVMTGEAALMDYELAVHGQTAEDEAAGLADGKLGLARETSEGLNAIINEGVKRGFSIGECLGRGILERQPRHFDQSLLATGAARLVPVTVHVTMGADGFHRYPGADGGMLGKGSLKDGLILGTQLSTLEAGGVIVTAHGEGALTGVLVHALALGRNLNEGLGGLKLLRLTEEGERLEGAAGVEETRRVRGALEVMVPLLMGALFSLVE